MRSGSLLVIAWLAACGSIDRVTFEVEGTPETARIEVFIASESACEKCELQPKDVASMLEGARFERDPDPVLEVRTGADHTAAFAIAPGEHTDKVRSIVVIGYDAPGAISGAALIRNIHVDREPKHYRVTLSPVLGEVLDAMAPGRSGQRAQVWGREEVHGKCVGFERWHDSSLDDRVFIVPADDPDCDGVLEDAECNPYAYLSSTGSNTGAINCVTDDEPVAGANPCQLGSVTCVDGGARGTCAPRGVCIPDSLCEDTSLCPDGRERECLLEKLQRAAISAEVVCTIPLSNEPTLGPCDGPDAAAEIVGLSDLFLGGTVACDGAGLLTLDSPSDEFTPEVPIGTAQLKVTVTPLSTCSVFATWEGSTATVPDRIGLRLFTTGPRDLVFPLRLVTTTCQQQAEMTCHFKLDADLNGIPDSIEACVK